VAFLPALCSSERHHSADLLVSEILDNGQLSEVKMVRDLDFDLGSGQGHINIHSTCRSTCRPNHVPVALHSTEIWPFEFRQMSILDEV